MGSWRVIGEGSVPLMHQPTFASVEFEQKKRKTRRELFLERIDSLVPWDELEAAHRAALPQGGTGTAALPAGGDAAHPLRPALLQPQRPCDGGSPLRSRVGAALLRPHPDRGHSRREHHPPLPPPAGAPRPGNEAVRDNQRPPREAAACACARARSWTPASSRRPPRRRTGGARATRRCTRRRRGTSGASA